jgi:ferritin-like protein
MKRASTKEAAMAGEMLHEERDALDPAILDRHRAISTIMEELEAIDWYDQRIKASTDQELQAILAHNRNEEKEHASMLLEWLRRHDSELDAHLRTYLFSEGRIHEKNESPTSLSASGSLLIGSLKG